jgi:hypothetical protein
MYSLYFQSSTPALKEEQVVNYDKPKFMEYHGSKTRSYWMEFYFVGHYSAPYKISDQSLKFTDYKAILNDINNFDTLYVKADKDFEIKQLTFRGKRYIDTEMLLNSEKQNHHFFIFFRIMICIAISPILFFKNPRTFWHSGFEFEVRFTYLFLAMMAIGICFYFFIYGTDFIMGFSPK